MYKWKRQFIHEFRMVFCNPLLLTLPLIFAGFYSYVLFNAAPIDNLFQLAYNYHGVVNTFTLGLVIFMGIATIRRDTYRQSYDWIEGLPISFAMRVTVKYVVGMLYFSIFTLIVGIVYMIASQRIGIEPSLYMNHISYFMTRYELSYLVTYALAMLLAVCIPNRVIYLIGFCTWMFGTFFMQIFIIERTDFYFLNTFHLSQLYVSSNFDNDLWNYNLILNEINASNLFVIAFALMLLVLAIMLLDLKRPTRLRKINTTASILTIVIMCVCFIPYAQIWQERQDKVQQLVNNPNIKTYEQLYSDGNGDLPKFTFPIQRYDIDVVKEQEDTLNMKVRLQVPTKQLGKASDLKLTLNHVFQVDSVMIEGEKVDFKRDFDWISIPVQPSDKNMMQVELSYSGQVYDYPYNEKSPVRTFAFVKGKNVFLPYSMAWYPLAGQHNLYAKEENLKSYFLFTGTIDYVADWNISMKGFDNKLVTGLTEEQATAGEQKFSGSNLPYVSMLGADFITVKEAGLPVIIYTTPYAKGRAESIAKSWKEGYDYFTSWLGPLRNNISKALIINKQSYIEPINEGDLAVVYREQNENNYLLNQMMLGSKQGFYYIQNPKNDVRVKIRGLIWYVYSREVYKLSDEEILNHYGDSRMVNEVIDNSSQTEQAELGLRMREQVAAAIDQGKLNEIKALLKYYYEQGLETPLPYKNEMKKTGASTKDKPVTYEAWQAKWKQVITP
jgi:hypothetical protein